MTADWERAAKAAQGRSVEIDYTNWRGERSLRVITPTGVVLFERNEWHPVEQKLIEAFCHKAGGNRNFAIAGIHSWRLLGAE